MQKTLSLAQGDIALHVEKDNPAIGLYEKIGFTTPYLEMRFKRN
jgi:ribosomal protein S18 acetylase RimI-like enzyme